MKRDPVSLLHRGMKRVDTFCIRNDLPNINWMIDPSFQVNACGFYRPQHPFQKRTAEDNPYIVIYTPKCARPAGQNRGRNWNWPGSKTDRTPYGVCCHELGHHADYNRSSERGRYRGNYSIKMREASGEPKLTGYCPNDGEWFAEMFRLFVTNHSLLRDLRPKTYNLIRNDFTPIGCDNWRHTLVDAPGYVLENMEKQCRK